MRRSVIALLVAALLPTAPEPAFGHGGNYPRPALPPNAGKKPWAGGGGGGAGTGAGGPASPGPMAPSPGPGAPRTPSPPPLQPPLSFTPERVSDELPDFTRWQLWWSYNHDPYLDLRARLEALLATTGPDGRIARRRDLRRETLRHLFAFTETGGKTPLLRQVLIALARLGDDPNGRVSVGLQHSARHFLTTDRPEMHEAAILALGVLGHPESAPLLRHLLLDDEEGRAAMNGLPVGVRCRAFAAYALGLIGAEASAEHDRRAIAHALLDAVGRENSVDREVQVACVLALGLVPVEPCRDAEQALDPSMQIDGLHLCGGVQIEYLAAILDSPELDPWVRLHAATALGRLALHAGGGLPETDDHPAILSREEAQRLLVGWVARTGREDPVRHGTVVGLGLAADLDAEPGDAAVRSELARLTKKGDRLTRRLALIGLGETLARPANGEVDPEAHKELQAVLMSELSRGRAGRKPWAAVSLAVAGFGAMERGATVPSEVHFALRESLLRTKDDGEAAAFTLALAVLRDEDPRTHDALLRRYKKAKDAFLRTQVAMAVGWLRAQEAEEALAHELGDGTGSLPDVLRAATGLRLLGNKEMTPLLLARLESSEDLGEQRAIVQTIARLDLLDAGAALIALLTDEKKDPELRAGAAWALGVLSDSETIDWSADFANDLTYPYVTWTLSSPLGDAYGLLDGR